MNTIKFKFYTDYNQFYIHDKDYNGDISNSDFWTTEASFNRLAVKNDVLGVEIQSCGNVNGEIEIIEKPSSNTLFEVYDHIVEAGIVIKNGELQISSCPNNTIELKVKVKNGKYRIRIYSSNLSSVLERDLINDTDNDYYRIEVWPSNYINKNVLKQYIEIYQRGHA